MNTRKTIKQRIISLLVSSTMVLQAAAVMPIAFSATAPIAASAATSTVTSSPKAPTVGSVATGRNTIIVNFKSQNVNGYRLWIADNKNFKNKKIYDSSNTKFTINGLKANTKYYIKATTYVRKNGKKVYSSATNVSYNTRLSPTATATSKKSTYFTVSTSLKKESVTGYRIYIADNKNFNNSIKLQNKTGSFTQKNLKQNTTYYIKAYTYIIKNSKVYWGNPITYTIKTAAIPKAEIKTITTSQSTIVLSLRENTNLDGYCFWFADNANYDNKKVVSGNKTSFSFAKLKAGTKYYIKACGYVVRGGKNYYSNSNKLTVTTSTTPTVIDKQPTPPAAVKGFSVSSVTETSAALKWDKVSDANGYIVYKYDDAQKTWIRIVKIAANSTSYTVSGLSSGTTYKFAIKAYKTENGKEITSTSFPTVTATTKKVTDPTPVVTPPANVSGLNVSSITETSVTLKWNKVTDATGYIIYKYDDTNKTWVKTAKLPTNSTTTYIVSKLLSGTTYKFAVKAYKTVNTYETISALYATVSATTKTTTVTVTPPDSIQSIWETKVADNSISLEWDKISDATGYILYQYDNTQKTWVRIVKTTTNSTTYTVSNLDSATTYKFAVKAYKTINGREYTSETFPIATVTTTFTLVIDEEAFKAEYKAKAKVKLDEIRAEAQDYIDKLPSQEELSRTVVVDNVEIYVYALGNWNRDRLISLYFGATLDKVSEFEENLDYWAEYYLNYAYDLGVEYSGVDNLVNRISTRCKKHSSITEYFNDDHTVITYLHAYSMMDKSFNRTNNQNSPKCDLGSQGKTWVEQIKKKGYNNRQIMQAINEYVISLYERAFGKSTEPATLDTTYFSFRPAEEQSRIWEFIEDPEKYGQDHKSVCLEPAFKLLAQEFGIKLYNVYGGVTSLVYWDEETQTRYYINPILNTFYASGQYGAKNINTYTNVTEPYQMYEQMNNWYMDVSNSTAQTEHGEFMLTWNDFNPKYPLGQKNKYCGIYWFKPIDEY